MLLVLIIFCSVILEMSSAFNLDFEVSGIHGYVMMDSVMPALTEITCTFWMKSSDTTNYGTPVSYAVEGSDNAFLLIDYNGSVVHQEINVFYYIGALPFLALHALNHISPPPVATSLQVGAVCER